MLRIDVAQRRARLGVRHPLARRLPVGLPEIARAVVALHATDPATVFRAARARSSTVDVPAVERALYTDRTLIRLLGMRRTMFVLPMEEAAVVHAACARAVAADSRKRYVKLLTDAGVGDAATLLAELEDEAERALLARGEATGAQISTDVPRLRTQVTIQGGSTTLTSWVLLLLAADGRIARGRPLGGWTSSQWRWSPMQTWLPAGMPSLDTTEARVELVRLWLTAFGPGTVADLRWWTGWTATEVKRALAPLAPVEVDLGGATGLVLPSDTDPVPVPDPWVALLPGLDPTPMGWSQRDWYLGPHRPAVFDRNGNVGPTVWVDGRIVGGWAQLPTGEIVYRVLEDVGAAALAAVARAAGELSEWIGPVRVTPRFRTPLERTLTA